jgi:hypothetical protein
VHTHTQTHTHTHTHTGEQRLAEEGSWVTKGNGDRPVWVASRSAQGPEDGGGHPWAGQRQQSSQQQVQMLAKATEKGLAKKLGMAGEKIIQMWDLNDLKDDTMEMKDHVLGAQALGRGVGVGEECSAGRGGGVGEEGSAETCGSSDAMYIRALEIAQRLSGVVPVVAGEGMGNGERERDGGGGCNTSKSPISPMLRRESSPVSSTGEEDVDEGGMMGLGGERGGRGGGDCAQTLARTLNICIYIVRMNAWGFTYTNMDTYANVKF